MRCYIGLILVAAIFAISCGGGDDLSINGVTPDDVDCLENDFFNHVELLPDGNYPEELVTEDGTFWSCEDGELRIYANGMFTATWTGSRNDENYKALRFAQEACGLSHTQLPDYDGDWVVTQDGSSFCFRYDIMPGFIGCVSVTDVQQNTLRIIQYGREIGTVVVVTSPVECTLAEE